MMASKDRKPGKALSFGVGVMLVALIAWAALADADDIADCAHDRFIEAALSSRVVTPTDRREAARIAISVCLGPNPSDQDHDEFIAGVNRAMAEILMR